MKILTLLTIPLASALLLIGCVDEKPAPCTPQTTYYEISSSARSKTPYFDNPDFDTISFANEAGDTLTFALVKVDSGWYCKDENTNPEGCADNHCYRNLSGTYSLVKGIGNLSIQLTMRSDSHLNPTIVVKLKTYSFGFGESGINNTNYIYYIGDLTVAGRNFSQIIYEFNKDDESQNIRGYYNKNYGLVKIEDNVQMTSWSLIVP